MSSVSVASRCAYHRFVASISDRRLGGRELTFGKLDEVCVLLLKFELPLQRTLAHFCNALDVYAKLRRAPGQSELLIVCLFLPGGTDPYLSIMSSCYSVKGHMIGCSPGRGPTTTLNRKDIDECSRTITYYR